MTKLFGSLVLFLIPGIAQDVTGDWTGTLPSATGDKSVTLHLARGKNGRISGNLHGGKPAFWIPVDSVVVDGERLSFAFEQKNWQRAGVVETQHFDSLSGIADSGHSFEVKGTFEGALDPSGEAIHGLWSQTKPLPFKPTIINFRRKGAGAPEASTALSLSGFGPLRALDGTASAELIKRLEERARGEFGEVGNYTCLETMDRASKVSASDSAKEEKLGLRYLAPELKPLDTVRLEILATPGGGELYASPGDTRWERDPSKLVDGMTGNGVFISFLKNILITGDARFTYHGQEELGGKNVARFDFAVPPAMSIWDVSVLDGSGRVGMKGSIWVDGDNADLRRVEIHADDIPATLPVDELVVLLSYGRTAIGDRSVMIPDTAVMHLREKSGSENVNAMAFTHCRAFHVESTVSFDSAPPAGTEVRAIPEVRSAPTAILPAWLRIAVSLTTPMTDRTAVGALVEGKVSGNVTSGGVVLVPDGAKVKGRVRRLERYSSKEGSYFVVALEFTDLESARFFADFQNVDRSLGVEWSRTFQLDGMELKFGDIAGFHDIAYKWNATALPGVGAFIVKGSTFKIPEGFRTVWETRAISK